MPPTSDFTIPLSPQPPGLRRSLPPTALHISPATTQRPAQNPLDAGFICRRRRLRVANRIGAARGLRVARVSPTWRRREGPDLGFRLPRRCWFRFCSWEVCPRAARGPRSAGRRTCRRPFGPSGPARRCCSKPGAFAALFDSDMSI